MSLSDKEFYQMSVSITKALNPVEAALKVKHARAAIIGTFRTNGGQMFWTVSLRQPLMDNRFTAWKFCHLLHKILREGHPLCIEHSMRHRGMLIELGKLWGHLTDGYGVCIHAYTKLLVTKLEFHQRNPQFPGNMTLSKVEWDHLGGNDINVHFQLAVEMFDYMDDIMALQQTIFTSVNTFRITSMTPAGQCRLAPLIPLIQDSNQLYDFAVRLMFKLHSHLPNDLLSGHRERFRVIFKQLKSFYDQARNLQFFVNLITIPELPDHAPNFNSKVDFGNYQAPVVHVPEPDPEPDPVVSDLVDMSIPPTNNVPQTPEPTPSPSPPIDFDRLLRERDQLIQHLQLEVDRLGKCLKSLTVAHREELNHKEEHISKLNTRLTDIQEELTNTRLQKEEMELKAQTAPTLEQKVVEEEERAKASEEKFQKLKTMYTQIRDEHVKLLRTHGEMTKQLSTAKKETSELNTAKELLQAQLEEFQQKQTRMEEDLQKTTEVVQKEKEVEEKFEKLNTTYEQLKCRFDDLQADKSAEIAELQANIAVLEEVRIEHGVLNKKCQELEKIIEDKKLVEQSQQEGEVLITELRANLEEKSKNEEELQTELEKVKEESSKEAQSLQAKIVENEEKFKAELDEKHRNALETIRALELSLQDSKIHGDTSIRALLEACIKSSEKLAVRAMSENEFTTAAGTSSYFMMIAEELQEVLNELQIVYEKYASDNTQVEGLARKTVLSGHLLATIQIQGMTICNTSANIEQGEHIANEIKLFCNDVMSLFESLHQLPSESVVSPKIATVKEKLRKITSMIHDLTTQSDNSGQLGDMLEAELASMDKAIDAAASKIVEMLSKARASDSGIKLEVNEKILDTCTNLMQSIRILVQNSRHLQAEIVALGKGTASAKEFYKRNHQWTEGLISAAKSVAQGANLLVTAANKAVSGEVKHHFDIVVAAQEIAACTAQLVVASRVKAPRGSQKLSALMNASRSVTQATGTVVATAKDCTQQLEESDDLDLTKLTIHQAKTREMDIQVKVLELEQALQMERLRLAAYRRKTYHQNSDEK
ncbi:unnamed protein product [Hermetia illucens]|uniref:Huntingtin interacting protein 1 n=1 Tax=Hermetia illucens TaxID=343691 RepID=A0A7R8UIC6_HERIL|nr:unnamed protein product [Hermetia illucens]